MKFSGTIRFWFCSLPGAVNFMKSPAAKPGFSISELNFLSDHRVLQIMGIP